MGADDGVAAVSDIDVVEGVGDVEGSDDAVVVAIAPKDLAHLLTLQRRLLLRSEPLAN